MATFHKSLGGYYRGQIMSSLTPEQQNALKDEINNIMTAIVKEYQSKIDEAMDKTYLEGIELWYKQSRTRVNKYQEIYDATKRRTTYTIARDSNKMVLLDYETTFTLDPRLFNTKTRSIDKWYIKKKHEGVANPLTRDPRHAMAKFTASSTDEFILSLMYYEGIIGLPEYFRVKKYRGTRKLYYEVVQGEHVTYYRNKNYRVSSNSWRSYFGGRNSYFTRHRNFEKNLIAISN